MLILAERQGRPGQKEDPTSSGVAYNILISTPRTCVRGRDSNVVVVDPCGTTSTCEEEITMALIWRQP